MSGNLLIFFLLTATVTQDCTPLLECKLPLNNPQRDSRLGHSSDILYAGILDKELPIKVPFKHFACSFFCSCVTNSFRTAELILMAFHIGEFY
jgi:hypothetical protein